MKYINFQRIWSNPFYARWQKHFCPSCGEQMSVAKREAILTPEQARSRDFRPDAYGKPNMSGMFWSAPAAAGPPPSRK